MTRPLGARAILVALALLGALPAAAAGPDREESEVVPALRPSGLAAWERWLEPRQYRLGVPVDCAGAACGGSAESPAGSPSRDRQGANDRGDRGGRDSPR